VHGGGLTRIVTLNPYNPMKTIEQAQSDNASFYANMAKRAPWNSKTRKGWLALANAALQTAAWAKRQGI